MMRLLLICLIVLLFLPGCSSFTPCGNEASCTRVLFIGNSYTYVNDLPATFAKLANAGGHKVQVDMVAQGGWSLADHANSTETLDKLNSTDWDFVVLQEQSQIPSVEEARVASMYPAARALVQKINDIGATPIFFVTWAHREGFPDKGMNYESMQAQINQGYAGIARELDVPVAPVGNAWFTAMRQNLPLELWQEDGSHPTEQGTYLAATIFYAVIFRESPKGLKYHANLSEEAALNLQSIASQATINAP